GGSWTDLADPNAYCEGLLGNVWPSPLSGRSSTPTSGRASHRFRGRLGTLSPSGPCSLPPLLTRAVRSCGRKVSGACHGGNPLNPVVDTGKILANRPGASEEGSSTLPTLFTVQVGAVVDLKWGIVGRWKKYFEDLLNPTNLPSNEEVEGVDEIRPEYLKSLDVVGLSWLTRLCNIAWRIGDSASGVANRGGGPSFKRYQVKRGTRPECVPTTGDHTSQPPTLGGRSTPGYWRGEFDGPIVDPRIQEEECGFRPWSWNTGPALYSLHAGCLRVYGSLPNQSTCALWIWRRHSTVSLVVFCGECSVSMGIRGPLLRAVRSLYNRSRSLVRIAGSKSDLFPVHVGLRQGCPLSPVPVHNLYGQDF
ncbi:hypothetical protein L3Q82_025511, partial [Scortum barcoo]